MTVRTPPPDDTALAEAILGAALARGDGRTISPMDVARSLAGDHPDAWGPLMTPLRNAARRLMKEGRIVILRKGRPVDPDDFRGVYRLALPPASSGPGNQEVV